MLSVNNLTVHFGKTLILNSISFEIKVGSVVALVGRNGAGKTTTLRALMGLVSPSQGEISFDNDKLTSHPVHSRAKLGVGYMPEDRRLIPQWSVKENLTLPIWANVGTDHGSVDRIVEFIPELRDLLNVAAGKLSGGQQKLVSLGRALIIGHKLLLLDEPFEGVAPALAYRLLEILNLAIRQGRHAVLLTESDRSLSETIRTDLLTMERGNISQGRI